MSNSLDPDQYRRSVSPDLGPKLDCLQRLYVANEERVRSWKPCLLLMSAAYIEMNYRLLDFVF